MSLSTEQALILMFELAAVVLLSQLAIGVLLLLKLWLQELLGVKVVECFAIRCSSYQAPTMNSIE